MLEPRLAVARLEHIAETHSEAIEDHESRIRHIEQLTARIVGATTLAAFIGSIVGAYVIKMLL